MFYNNQPIAYRNDYKKLLQIIGSLSSLFSESNAPFLAYRAHENIFCKSFNTTNLSRKDCSIDAKLGNIGFGLKTWVGRDDQKIAEFGKELSSYKGLSGLALIKKISTLRNQRIEFTKNTYDIDTIIYHIVKRVDSKMLIMECEFDFINIEDIKIIAKRGNENNTYFTDGKNTYHFSSSKNTLYLIFENYIICDTVDIMILDDPYTYLETLNSQGTNNIINYQSKPIEEKLYLRLYSVKNNMKIVSKKSALNQWNAKGRPRNPNEMYIQYPALDRKRYPNFFPPREEPFKLLLPNGKIIVSKVCQDGGKAIMSNPNSELGEWLLRKVFSLKERTLLTYDMLEELGIDCVVFTKLEEHYYSINFSIIGTYEKVYFEHE